MLVYGKTVKMGFYCDREEHELCCIVEEDEKVSSSISTCNFFGAKSWAP